MSNLVPSNLNELCTQCGVWTVHLSDPLVELHKLVELHNLVFFIGHLHVWLAQNLRERETHPWLCWLVLVAFSVSQSSSNAPSQLVKGLRQPNAKVIGSA